MPWRSCTAAAWTPVSWELGAVESSVVVAMQRRRWRSQWVFPSLAALSLDRVRFSCWWVMAGPVNLVVRALISTSLYSAVRQGPTNHIRVGRRSKGPIGGDQLTFHSHGSCPEILMVAVAHRSQLPYGIDASCRNGGTRFMLSE